MEHEVSARVQRRSPERYGSVESADGTRGIVPYSLTVGSRAKSNFDVPETTIVNQRDVTEPNHYTVPFVLARTTMTEDLFLTNLPRPRGQHVCGSYAVITR